MGVRVRLGWPPMRSGRRLCESSARGLALTLFLASFLTPLLTSFLTPLLTQPLTDPIPNPIFNPVPNPAPNRRLEKVEATQVQPSRFTLTLNPHLTPTRIGRPRQDRRSGAFPTCRASLSRQSHGMIGTSPRLALGLAQGLGL